MRVPDPDTQLWAQALKEKLRTTSSGAESADGRGGYGMACAEGKTVGNSPMEDLPSEDDNNSALPVPLTPAVLANVKSSAIEDVKRFCAEHLSGAKVEEVEGTGMLKVTMGNASTDDGSFTPTAVDPSGKILVPLRKEDGRIVMVDRETKMRYLVKVGVNTKK